MSDPASRSSAAQQSASGRNNKKHAMEAFRRIRMDQQNLSQAQFSAIELMLRGLSDSQVGAQLGVDRGTVYRWRMSSLFRSELEKQRKALFEHSAARLSSMIEPALEILNRQLTGDDPKTALRAAAILLRVATPSRLGHVAADEAKTKKSDADAEWARVKAFIDSPVPNSSLDEDDERDEDDESEEE